METEEFYDNLSGKILTINEEKENQKSDDLYRYILNKDIESIKKYISTGGSVNEYKNKEDTSPLHDAMDTEILNLFNLILENTTDNIYILDENKEGITIIDRALKLKRDNIFRIIIRRMSIVNLIYEGIFENTKEWEEEVVNYEMVNMIQYGTFDHAVEAIKKVSSINWRDSFGCCALYYAVSSGKENIVKFLIRHGANPNSVNNCGTSVLRPAIVNYPIFKFLVDNGAHLDIEDNDGETVRGLLAEVYKAKITGNIDFNSDNCLEIASLVGVLDENIYAYVKDDFVFEFEAPSQQIRLSIPSQVKREVWRRDEGRCTECSSQENLEYDHIIPVSKGGANTVRNIQLLCQFCNRTKSNTIM